MSFKLIVKIMEEVDLPRPQTAILLAMAENANDDGGQCFPSVDLIAWKAGYKPRQVSNIIRDLEKSKVVNKVAEATRHRPVEYKIMIENAPKKLPFDLWKKQFSRHKGKDLGVQSRDKGESRDAVSQHLGMQSRDSRDAMDCTRTGHGTIQEEPSSSDSDESSSASAGDSNAEDQELGKVANEKPGETSFGMASEVYRLAGVDFAKLGGSEIAKQCAVAKRMLKDGVSISEAREIASWLLSDNFRAKNGIDMFAVERNRSRWYTATGGVRRDQFEVDWSDESEGHVDSGANGDDPWAKMYESMKEDYFG